jgi:hypothetical protein
MSVYHSIVGHIPEFDRGIKRARFAVLRLTSIPAILVEGGFMTESAEARLIANPAWRGKLAEAISIGIENYKALVDKRQKPMLLADYRRQLGGANVAAHDLAQPPRDLPSASPSMLRASIQPQPLSTPSAQETKPAMAQGENENASPPPPNAAPAPNQSVAPAQSPARAAQSSPANSAAPAAASSPAASSPPAPANPSATPTPEIEP